MCKRISVIIVSWNVCHLLLDAIASVMCSANGVELEVIVVDNGSSDGTPAKVRDAYPDVIVIEIGANLGFARANNIGMQRSTGDYILLLNPDTRVGRDAIGAMARFMDEHPDVGLVGPMLLSGDGRPQRVAARRSYTLLSTIVLDIVGLGRIPLFGAFLLARLRYPYDLQRPGYVEVISGAAMMMRASMVRAVGGLSEAFFMCGEDIEFCDRVNSSGYRVYYLPTARIVHYGQSCTPVDPVGISINRLMSSAHYYSLKYGRMGGWMYRLAVLSVGVPKLLMSAVAALVTGRWDVACTKAGLARGLVRGRFVGDAAFMNSRKGSDA